MAVGDLLKKIGAVAKIEGKKVTPLDVKAEAELPDPDFSKLTDEEVSVWVRRFSLFETRRRLREDNAMSELRKTYADRIYRVTRNWLFIVVLLVVATGITLPNRSGFQAGLWSMKFQLSDPVLIAFIGTTTVNVIALFLAVTAWLFPKDAAVHADTEKPKPKAEGQPADPGNSTTAQKG